MWKRAAKTELEPFAAEIQAEKLRMLYQRGLVATLAGIPWSVVLLVALLGFGSMTAAWWWFALRSLWTLVRVAVWYAFRVAGRPDTPFWGALFTGASLIDGLIWGLVGTWLLPADRLNATALIIAALVGTAAVGAFVTQARLRVSLAFNVPLLLPCAVFLLALPTREHLLSGIAVLLFMGIMAVEAARSEGLIGDQVRLRLTADALARNLALALAQAHRASAAKSQFLASMSHEMRTPLHGMLGLAAQLRGPGAPAAERGHKLDLIERSGEHLLRLISDVLDFARIEAGQISLTQEAFDLAAVIQDVASLARGQVPDKDLAVEAQIGELGAAGSWVLGDGARVRQVLHCLVGNAVKFTDQGRVRLHASRSADGRVRVEVEDSGRGIPPAHLDRVFDAFHQVEGDFDRRHGGAGLGLTIARELAQAMGGSLDVRSTLGLGSVFSFEAPLPPVPAPPPAADAPEFTAPTRLQGRVLLAEDNPVNALVAEAILRQAGVAVDLAVDGKEAVARWARDRHDLILMDCQMPEQDGFAATRAIRAQEADEGGRSRVPIVALTANAYDSDRELCLAAGMDGHLAKPFKAEALLALLGRHLPPADAA